MAAQINHIINCDIYYEDHITLKEPVKVKIGDCRSLHATKIGNVSATFLVCGKESVITLTDVIYVKDMDSNLISCAK